MCIPCVMCGACMEKVEDGDDSFDTTCPECGEPVAPSDLSCPHCFAFLPHNAACRARRGRDESSKM